MTGDCHVRFLESVGVKSPCATYPVAPFVLSVIAKMMGIPIPFTNPYALIRAVRNAIGAGDEGPPGGPSTSPSTATQGLGEGDVSPGPEGSSTDTGPTPGSLSPGPKGSSTDTGPLGPTVTPDPDVIGYDIDAYGDTGGEGGGGSPGNAGSSNAGEGSPMSGGGQEGDADSGFGESEGAGEGGGVCIIATACAGHHSPETNLLREYRDKFLNNRILGGYYALCYKIAPWLTNHKKVAGFVKSLVVDRWVDIAQVRLGYKRRPYLKTSKITGDAFLKLCNFVGKFVDCPKWIDKHKN